MGIGEMLQYTLVAVRNAVMCLIYDDCIKIVFRELTEPLFTHHRLYGTDYDAEPAVLTGFFCFFHRTAKPGRFPYLIGCLFEQFAPVCQDQHTVTSADAVLRHLGEYDRLSASGWQDQQGFLHPAVPLFKYGFSCLLLIWS